jgi:hypothetical protein
MRTLVSLVVASCSLLAATAPVAAQGAGAQTFTIPVDPHGSARAAFRQALASMPALDGVRLRSALADMADRFVEGAFTASFHGRTVSGVLLAGTSGSAVGAFDATDRAPRTIPAALAQLASRGRSGGGPPNRPLHRVAFGTGAVSLPDSWSVLNSYQGCVEAASTHDHAYLAFGCPQAAVVPPLLPGTNPRTVLVLGGVDPVAALQRLLVAPPPAGLGVAGVRVVEAKPVQATANGRAAYVLFDYTANGAPFRGLALVNVAGVDRGLLMVYKSMFMTPRATFPQLAPVLWKSWQSWAVNGDVLSNRLFAAAQSMRETGDIITGAYWERQHAQDRVNLGFDQYIRDAAQLENTDTGQRWNGSWLDVSAIAQSNPARYRVVPLSDLQP